MTAGLVGETVGPAFITGEREGAGVGFLSQIPRGLEIQKGLSPGPTELWAKRGGR